MTSVEDPLPVDSDTLYVLRSVTKTYTATALMRSVAEGRVDLDAPARRYVPELMLADEQTAAHVTVRFAVGHNLGEDGKLSVARLWKGPRYRDPGGGMASSLSDQLRLARFHLGNGRAETGERVLPAALLDRMKEPTVELRGSSLGDAFGICWFLRDVEGVRTVGHGGSASGQFTELLTVPERDFAVVSMTNAGPHGIPFNQAVLRRALEKHLGVVDRDPGPLPYDEVRAREFVGRYQNDAIDLNITTDGAVMTLAADIKPEIRAGGRRRPPPRPARGRVHRRARHGRRGSRGM